MMNRRGFLKLAATGSAGIVLAGLGYSRIEAGWIQVTRETIPVPRLPKPFEGITVALLTDLHHGHFTSLDYIREVVRLTNSLKPDLITLGGDYIYQDARYIGPCFEVLAGLHTPIGVFGVLGNHDHYHSAYGTRKAMRSAGILELSNRGCWLETKGTRLRLAGVDDLWTAEQDLDAALEDTTGADACVLLCHNPDYVETLTDRRVGLVLSGHTHGGQMIFPWGYAPVVSSKYGQKYLRGLIRTADTQVFVSRGLGTVTPPLRFCCRPEINLITLVPEESIGRKGGPRDGVGL